MRIDQYELKAESDFTTFEFLSEGPKGRIIKVIQFQQIGKTDVYNLAFGDFNTLTGKLDDKIVTGNSDSEKVLATVVAAVYSFTEHYPDTWVYAIGSTESRTRLYRMGINKYFKTANSNFDILGEHEENGWEWYEKGADYKAFAVHKKLVNLDYENNNRNR